MRKPVLLALILACGLVAAPAQKSEADCKRTYESNCRTVESEHNPAIARLEKQGAALKAELARTPKIKVAARQQLERRIATVAHELNEARRKKNSALAQAKGAYESCLAEARKKKK